MQFSFFFLRCRWDSNPRNGGFANRSVKPLHHDTIFEQNNYNIEKQISPAKTLKWTIQRNLLNSLLVNIKLKQK